jgi:hypothetical protein
MLRQLAARFSTSILKFLKCYKRHRRGYARPEKDPQESGGDLGVCLYDLATPEVFRAAAHCGVTKADSAALRIEVEPLSVGIFGRDLATRCAISV